MSWLRSVLSFCVPDSGAYYSAIDPIEFYEWRFNREIPQGALFTSYLPPSEVFTQNKIIVSSVIPESNLTPVEDKYRVSCNTPSDVVLKIGYMPSPMELIDKYKDIRKSLDRGLDCFKEDITTRKYLYSKDKKPKLLRMSNSSEDKITFDDFGELKELIERFAIVRDVIMQETTEKTGRSYEMEEFRKFDNIMTYVNNAHLHVDAVKMDQLITSSNTKPESTKTLSWKEFYLQSSQGAAEKRAAMDVFESKSWFQNASSIINKDL